MWDWWCSVSQSSEVLELLVVVVVHTEQRHSLEITKTATTTTKRRRTKQTSNYTQQNRMYMIMIMMNYNKIFFVARYRALKNSKYNIKICLLLFLLENEMINFLKKNNKK